MNIKMTIMKLKQQLNAFKSSVLLITAIVFSGSVQAVNIAQQPLFLTQAATPNIMFVLDDSGSMDWDILVPPHWEATNYDRDYRRSWARGGDLNSVDRNLGRRAVGDWVSHNGQCWDRNVDGICHNSLDLNSDGDKTDREKASTGGGQDKTYLWKIRLWHEYQFNYPSGQCNPPPDPPPAGNSDASDFLPQLDGFLALISGSTNANAHSYTGTNWGADAPDPYAGMMGESGAGNADGPYAKENWDRTATTYNLTAAEQDEKDDCDALTDGSAWVANSVGLTLTHDGVTPWDSAGTFVDNTAATLVLAGYSAGVVGDYHREEAYDDGLPFIANTPDFDINGDGAFNTNYRENDGEAHRRTGYEYISWQADNVYYSADASWTCQGGSWSSGSPEACMHLQYTDYPNNYAYDATAPVTATSWTLPGNENILTLPSTVNGMRHVPPAIVVGKDFSAITWAAWSDPARGIVNRTTPVGTRHALNKWDEWPLVVDWRARSSGLNVLYYSPTADYAAWPGLADASFNAAHSNPQPGTAGFLLATKDLVRPQTGVVETIPALMDSAGNIEEGGFVYEVWHDDAGYWSNSPQWYPGDTCGIPTVSNASSINGWKAENYDGNYGATVRSTVLGTVDPATGHVVAAGDRVCSTYNNEPNGEVDLWDKRDRVTVYNDGILVQTVRRTPHIMGEFKDTDVSQKYFMSDTRILDTVTYLAGSTYPIDGFCETVLGVDPDNIGNCKTVAQVQQNVANWYEFSRKRSFVAKGAIAKLIETLPDLNYGLMGTSRSDTVANNKTNATDLSVDLSLLFRDVYDGTGSGNGEVLVANHNAALQSSLYSHAFRQSGTPLRQSLQRVGEYFAGRGPVLGAANSADDHSTSPITIACQKNFAIMLTDGYWSGLAPIDVSGADGSSNAISLDNADADPYTKTLADVAKYYYDEDLNTSMDNIVPTDAFDTNNAQHLTTIGIGFGVSGEKEDTDSDGWPNPALTESSNWGNPTTNPRKIDDLWHAAYNSRGLYFSARDPAELIQRLNDAVLFATATVGSASAVTSNERVLSLTTRIYQTIFKSGEWSGDVKSYGLTANGLIVTPAEWSAQAELDDASVTYDTRRIITSGVANAGIRFRWGDLVDASNATASAPDQQTALQTRWATGVVENVAFGQDQLNYLRGRVDAQFRDRSGHKLGDIVHSEPVYVGTPTQLYSDTLEASTYSGFKTAQSGRAPMIYVGANDGMMHAFDASTGVEKYAYIPRVLIPGLNALSHKNTPTRSFSHQYYVDATPSVNDVFYVGSWHTVLAGGLGGGGKGIYTLDVTTVPADAEAVADNVALWEFTDVDDADMGYSFSKPSIVRLNNGNWAAVFGNGYDSSTGKSVLYIVEFSTDSAYGTVHKFDTGIGTPGTPSGMSTPTVIDTDGDMKADRVYAGDLLGHVWSIDISDVDDTKWKFSFDTLVDSNNIAIAKTPLFSAINDSSAVQPITTAITIDEHPLGALAGYLLHFGTGKFFSSTDNSETGQDTQSLYALWDYGTAGITRADLLKQEIIAEVTHVATGAELRVTSNNESAAGVPIRWLSSGQVGDAGWTTNVDRKGWRMDLYNTESGNTDNYGERIVSQVALHGDSVLYSTLLPASDPCEGGGSGWLMTLNAETGARFYQSPFDINGDGSFNSDDFASWNDGSDHVDAASGVKSESGIPSIPLILNSSGGQAVVISDHSSGDLPEDVNGVGIGGDGGGVGGGGASACSFGGCLVNGATTNGRKSWMELDY